MRSFGRRRALSGMNSPHAKEGRPGIAAALVVAALVGVSVVSYVALLNAIAGMLSASMSGNVDLAESGWSLIGR